MNDPIVIVGAARTPMGAFQSDFASLSAAPLRRVRAAHVPGWRVVELDRDARAVRVPAGVVLDLGATAKAVAADRAAQRALAAGPATGVLVNLGGDVATAGAPPPGGWALRVADSHLAGPSDPGQTLMIASGGLSTSSTTVRRSRSMASRTMGMCSNVSSLPPVASEIRRT